MPFYLENRRCRLFCHLEFRARLLRTFGDKMNNRQNMHPIGRPEIEDERKVNPLIAKLRRKLGLTYIVDNPFQVPVAQSTAAGDADASKKAKKSSI
jgi:hypothetical protein